MNLKLILLIAVSTMTTLAAMECGPEFSQRHAFRSAILVFRGKVVKIEDVGVPPLEYVGGGKVPMQPATDSGEPKLATFEVEQVWKGRTVVKIKMFGFMHPPEGDGYRFQLGNDYVVYSTMKVNPGWEPLDRLREGYPVYDVGMCPLRIRTDVANESRLLGNGKVVTSKSR